ncbi:VOC family protein [Nocardiopsis aegyptia]|uniref:VOC family protein n=1 Tax=Nocardiopsis aegyptia TaxID=220378 RepID=UPI003671FF98
MPVRPRPRSGEDGGGREAVEPMAAFYHVCFVVPDLEAAMGDLAASAGVGWSEPRSDRIGDWDFRIVFTTGGAPFIELIEGPEGSPWDCGGRARFDHLGFWSASVERASAALTAAGMPEDFSGCPYGRPFAYHRVEGIGARVEMVDASRQEAFLRAWDPGGAAMPVLPAPGPAGAADAE